jgi:HD-GYP domain
MATLSAALDAAASAPSGHTLRTCFLAMRLAEALGIGDRDRSSLLYAALLHEAGSDHAAGTTERLAIRRLVVLSRGSEVERRIDDHARARRGAQVALRAGFGPEVAVTVMALHEHWDGRGLPIGLAGSAIPPFPRLVAVCHDLDRLTQERGARHAEEEIHARAGSWYDPELVGVLLALCSNGLMRELADDELADRVADLEPSWLERRSDADGARRIRGALGPAESS